MKPRVYVCQPVYGSVPAEAAVSFARLLAQGSADGLIRGVGQNTYSLLGAARNQLVKQALATDCTHLFFVDADMVLSRHALPKLLARDCPVVSGLYFQRTPPFYPVVYNPATMQPVLDYPSGLSEGHYIGLGCALIEAKVLRSMAAAFHDEEWFKFEQKLGEDIWFCRRCSMQNVPIYLDADVKCGHVAQIEITEEHFQRHHAGDKAFL